MKKYISTFVVSLVSLCAVAGVPAQEPSEGYVVTADKVRLFYKIEGTGAETLVAVHGGPGNSLESIRADLEPLAKGRRVIYYDQRGSGRSDIITDGKKLGFENHVADLEAVRRHFKLEKITLLGNSWGGLLISLYAVAHPDRVERMVLHNPAPPIQGFLTDTQDEISARMKSLYKPEQLDRGRFVERSENWLKASDPVLGRWINHLPNDFCHEALFSPDGSVTYVALASAVAKMCRANCEETFQLVGLLEKKEVRLWTTFVAVSTGLRETSKDSSGGLR